jgi:hypothetical protein
VIRSHATTEKRHGRLEERRIEVTSLLCGYLAWPGVKQVFRLSRRRCVRGSWSEEVAYGITSYSEREVTPAALLSMVRRHWAIENSLHYVRDVTFLEDRCRTRSRNLAQTLAAARNTVITLLRQAGYAETPEGLEDFAEDRMRAIRAVRYARTE